MLYLYSTVKLVLTHVKRRMWSVAPAVVFVSVELQAPCVSTARPLSATCHHVTIHLLLKRLPLDCVLAELWQISDKECNLCQINAWKFGGNFQGSFGKLWLNVSLHFPGPPRVIGSLTPIVAAPGDDVILPCHLEPSVNVEALTLEWSKPDLKPDPSDRLSRVEYVHLYRDRREVPDMKIQSYVKRTALFTDGLKHGNISLKIMNVSLEDGGRYKCFIPKLKSPFKDSVVQLVVGEFVILEGLVSDPTKSSCLRM